MNTDKMFLICEKLVLSGVEWICGHLWLSFALTPSTTISLHRKFAHRTCDV